MRRLVKRAFGLWFALTFCFGLSALAPAASLFWDGSGTGWNTATFWSTSSSATTPNPASPPGSADVANFNISTINTAQTVNLNANQSALGLVFSSTGTVLIQTGTGTNTLTLGTSGITVNSGAGADTISSLIALGGAQLWTNNSTNLLTLSNTINTASNALTVAGTGNTTISGALGGGSGGLVKSGAGTLTLNNSNTFTGGVTINAGVLQLSSAGAVNAATPNAVVFGAASTGTLNLAGTNETVSGLNSSTGSPIIQNNNANAATLTVDSAATNTFAGVIQDGPFGGVGGLLSLAKSGSGSLTLSGNNTFNGSLTLNAGTLNLNGSNQISNGVFINGGSLNVGNNAAVQSGVFFGPSSTGILSLLGHNITVTDLETDATVGSPIVRNLNATPATLTVNNAVNPATYAGVIQDGTGGGALSLTKIGAGTLTLTGSNTYTGTLTIADGTLTVGSAANLGSPGSIILQTNSTLRNTGPLTYASGINLQGSSTFNTDGGDLTLSGPIIGAGQLTKTGPNFLTLTNTNSVRTGSTIINQGILSISTDANLSAPTAGLTIANNALLLTLAPITMSRPITLASGGQISPTGTLTLNGNVSGSGPLTVGSGGELVLGSLNNSYTAGTIVDFGTLGISADANLGSSGSLTLADGGTLQALAPLTLVRPVVLNNGGGQFDTNGNNVIVNSTLSVAQSATLTKAGAGTLTLPSPSYAGSTTILGGQVVVNNGNLSNAFTLFGGTLTLNSSNMNMGINALTANGGSTIEYRNTAVAGGYLMGSGIHTIPADSFSTTFTATQILSGADVRILAGQYFTTFERVMNGGKLTISSLIWGGGANTSSGNITLNGDLTELFWSSDGVMTINPGASLTNAGSNLVLGGGSRTYIGSPATHGGAINLNGFTLELNGALLVNNGAIDGTVNVNYGSTAKGAGTYAIVNVTDGGVYAPGNSPGIVTASAVTFSNTSTIGGPALQIEIAGTAPGTQYDQLHVTGQLALGGTLQVLLTGSFTPAAGNSFDILDFGSRVGTFSSLQLPSLTAPLGWDTSQLYTAGVLSVTATLHGDWNRDGQVTAADIPAMLSALTDLNHYKTTNTLTDLQLAAIGDFDSSGSITNRDIQGLLDLVATQGGGAIAAVPEPASVVLLCFGAVGISRKTGRGRRDLGRS